MILWTSISILVIAVVVGVKWARVRLVSLNVAAASLAVLLFLAYDGLAHRVNERFEPAVWSQRHEVVGIMARPNQVLRWKRKIGFNEVFDIAVTTNADGFRVTPPAPDATRSIMFFGCSFTFGHGVEDYETYPYLVGESLNGTVATYNISFNGWGPHEVLAALQSGLVEGIVKEPPELAVFLTIPDHVRRVIGRYEEPWMAEAPRFVLDDDAVVRRGRFADDPLRQRYSANDPGYWTTFSADDFKLYGAVVKAVRDEVVRRFPDTRFEVILWDEGPSTWNRRPMTEALRVNGIAPHVSEEFLADGESDPFRYLISKNEPHPNPEGLRMLARFIETQLLGKD